MTFEQARAAELTVLTQVADAIRSAPALAELFSLGATAMDRLNATLSSRLISTEEADHWRASSVRWKTSAWPSCEPAALP